MDYPDYMLLQDKFRSIVGQVFQMILQLCDPLGNPGSNGSELAIAVYCSFCKAVVIIIELSFITVGEHPGKSIPARKTF